MALARSNIRAPNLGAKSRVWSALCLQSMAFNNSFSVRVSAVALIPKAERPLDEIELMSQVLELFARMVEIHDLNRAGKMPVGKIPDPVRAIAHDNTDRGLVPAPIVDLRIDPEAEVLGGLDSADIGGGSLIARRPALIIDTRFG